MAPSLQLSTLWQQLALRYSSDELLINQCWDEIVKNYSADNRHYHNLEHLEYMVELAEEYSTHLTDIDAVLFAIFFHDIVYSIHRKDNELKSAELANMRLSQLDAPDEMISACEYHIMATKHHQLNPDRDSNFVVDFDLAILGSQPEVYREYSKKIRAEFNWYPDILYNPGRKKVLKHFLAMDQIFKTPEFYERCERQARVNLNAELREL